MAKKTTENKKTKEQTQRSGKLRGAFAKTSAWTTETKTVSVFTLQQNNRQMESAQVCLSEICFQSAAGTSVIRTPGTDAALCGNWDLNTGRCKQRMVWCTLLKLMENSCQGICEWMITNFHETPNDFSSSFTIADTIFQCQNKIMRYYSCGALLWPRSFGVNFIKIKASFSHLTFR